MNAIAWNTSTGARNFVYAGTADTQPGAYISDCKETPPSQFVLSEKGQKVQKKVWEELRDIWIKVDPKTETILA